MKTELFQLQPEEYPMLALCVSRSPSNETFLKKILFPLDPEHYLALPPLYGQFNAHGHCYNNSVKNAPLLQATLMTCDLSTCLCLSEAIFFIFWPSFCTCNWKPFEWASEMHMTPKPQLFVCFSCWHLQWWCSRDNVMRFRKNLKVKTSQLVIYWHGDGRMSEQICSCWHEGLTLQSAGWGAIQIRTTFVWPLGSWLARGLGRGSSSSCQRHSGAWLVGALSPSQARCQRFSLHAQRGRKQGGG